MRKKREIQRFAKWCFGYLNLPPIQIHYCNAHQLIDLGGDRCFGCYTYDDNKELRTKEIWLPYKQSKWTLLLNAAHEIWHYKQDRDGRICSMSFDDSEKEAEKASEELLAMWIIRGGKVTVE